MKPIEEVQGKAPEKKEENFTEDETDGITVKVSTNTGKGIIEFLAKI